MHSRNSMPFSQSHIWADHCAAAESMRRVSNVRCGLICAQELRYASRSCGKMIFARSVNACSGKESSSVGPPTVCKQIICLQGVVVGRHMI